jgi:hypothetical protein
VADPKQILADDLEEVLVQDSVDGRQVGVRHFFSKTLKINFNPNVPARDAWSYLGKLLGETASLDDIKKG